ncbi:MAG TPA: helix-turn-helix domain-containing protein, partial [Euzebyales bacterium]|nr:helix-turn-helix domain-containing protein [Euzebyales bacterium]
RRPPGGAGRPAVTWARCPAATPGPESSQRVGVAVVSLSILRNGRARAIRFSTLVRLCEVLDCQPGDLLSCAIVADGDDSSS